MTREEFTENYARRSNLTIDELAAHGLRAYRCQCEEEDCEGWQMLTEESARVQVDLGHMSLEDFEAGGTV